MGIERELLGLFTEFATIEPSLGATGFGDRRYGPPLVAPDGTTKWRARSEGDTSRVLNVAGEQRRSKLAVYIAGTPSVAADDRVTLGDGTQSSALTVDTERDERGPHHVVIWL